MRGTTIHTDNDLQHATLRVLHYYALFQYPINAAEIHGSCSKECSLADIKQALNELVSREMIFTQNNYYSTLNNIAELVTKREKGNALSIEKEVKAKKAGKLIYKFPFVKFVGISGSLSKGCATPDSDFDFFVVTETNRLWICRTLLHLFKKLTFLVGKQHSFCMNYFVDQSALTIDDKNIFTAIELSSLMPVCGSETYTHLIESNKWINCILPNGYVRFKRYGTVTSDNNLFKKMCEYFFNHLFPSRFNYLLMRFTDKRWRKKWAKKNFPMDDYDLAFRTTLHVSKNHEANYQKKVLTTLQKAGFEQ